MLLAQLYLTCCNPWTLAWQAPLFMEFSKARILEWVVNPIRYLRVFLGTSLVVQRVKNLPVMRETWLGSLGWEDPPGAGNGNSLKYTWMVEPGRLQSMGSQTVGHY